ncbi:replicative DNA helicase [Variovorax sp. WS11]|nr:replicative DNA helicase [Variovorax sp. WS11]
MLGALMLDSAAWDSVGDILIAQQFFAEVHRRIFTAISSLVLTGKPVDIITVHEHLESSGQAEGIDLAILNRIQQSVSSTHAVRRHAEIVAERSLMRGLMAAADDVRSIAVTPGVPVSERLDKAQARLQELQVHRVRRMPVPIQDLTVTFLDRLTDLSEGKIEPGIPTHIPALDKMLGGGLKPGAQVVLAARPSVGKSSFAQQICLNVAADGQACAFFSQEMQSLEVTQRAFANLGRIGLDNIQSGSLADHEWGRLTDAMERVRKLSFHIDDQPALTLMDIAAKARMLKRQHDVKLIAIDYLQLCAAGKAGESRHHQIEELSRGTKVLARQLDITILLLSQLNREVEKRVSGRAVLSDLKESGAIEEDADVVILLNKTGDARQDGTKLIACDVPKNRQGRTGEFALHFDGPTQRWEQSSETVVAKGPPARKYTSDL